MISEPKLKKEKKSRKTSYCSCDEVASAAAYSYEQVLQQLQENSADTNTLYHHQWLKKNQKNPSCGICKKPVQAVSHEI